MNGEALKWRTSGMDACTLQPAAGAHGEITGIMLLESISWKQRRFPKRIRL